VLEKYPKEVKLVLKNFPLPQHAFARKAAQGALAASKQQKFSEFQGKIFANQNSLNDGKIRDVAREIGLNMDQFERDMKDPRLQSVIDRDIRQANEAGVHGTPTVFVNGKLLRNITIQGFQGAIGSELNKKK
jgi:protein-disulfide isomerase